MAKSFEDILTSMLEQLENNPDQDIDVLVKDECEKMGVSEEGRSRKQWMLAEMDRVLEGRDEQEKTEIVSAISDAGENVNNETLKEEED